MAYCRGVLVALLIRWAVLALAFAVTSALLSGMDVSGGFGSYLWVALLFGVVNALLGTVLRIVTLPLTILTLGLFAIVINAALLELTDALTSHLTIDDFFWTAIWAAVILAVVSVALELALSLLLGRKRT
jgi:putative membrane protein